MRNRLRSGLFGLTLAMGIALAPPMAPMAAAQGLAGPYLAGSQADLSNDYAAAATYYDAAMRAVPDNAQLVNAALVVNIISGRMSRALEVARALRELDPANQLMALTVMAEAFRNEDYSIARDVAAGDAYNLNPLFAGLAEGWAEVGAGDFADGIATFEAMTGGDAMEAYGTLNQALAYAFAGDFETAALLLDGGEDGPLHLNRMALLTHIISLSHADRTDEALSLVEDSLIGRPDPTLTEMRDRLAAGEALPFDQIESAADGAANAFAVMGIALTREDAARLGLVYARLATHIRPTFDEATTLIGDTLAAQGQYNLAIGAYEEVAPDSPWYTSAEIGRADALHGAERSDEAIEVLSHLARAEPETMSIHVALGDLLRRTEAFDRAAEAYSRAVDLIEEDAASQWRLYYVRGISYERTDVWDQAEADFRKALELNPDQPDVLNYLGYSLVELRQNLDEALDMIERAVAQDPENGYITDSLGWVYYRLGRFEDAVEPMERAVELAPVDPIINDHLGDVLWKVDRKMEARFQWKRALSFDPEEEDAARIRRKLEVGLDTVLEEEAATETAAPATAGGD